MLDVLQTTTFLKMLPRSGWLFAGVSQPESVADHSWATTLLAISLALRLNEDPQSHGLSKALDVGRIAQIAAVHDLAESVVTDLPHRATHLIGKSIKAQAEERALLGLSELAGLPELVDLWKEYNTLSTPEGRLVADADKLEMMHQALAYERAGNQNLGEWWHERIWHYQLSEEVYSSLVQARPSWRP